MRLTSGEFWLLFHLGIGVLYTHGIVAGLLAFKIHRWYLQLGYLAMAGAAWITVISGTYFVYPGYRANPGEVSSDQLTNYPQQYLEHDPSLAYWHDFGMEWKEHVSWLSP